MIYLASLKQANFRVGFVFSFGLSIIFFPLLLDINVLGARLLVESSEYPPGTECAEAVVAGAFALNSPTVHSSKVHSLLAHLSARCSR